MISEDPDARPSSVEIFQESAHHISLPYSNWFSKYEQDVVVFKNYRKCFEDYRQRETERLRCVEQQLAERRLLLTRLHRGKIPLF